MLEETETCSNKKVLSTQNVLNLLKHQKYKMPINIGFFAICNRMYYSQTVLDRCDRSCESDYLSNEFI